MSTHTNPLYISDLDGTLLRNDATLSPYSRKALMRLLDQGLSFTVASARSVSAIRSFLQGISLPLPVIDCNGAFISDLDSGRHHIINSLDTPLVQDVLQCMLDQEHMPFISAFDGRQDRLYYNEMLNQGMQWYLDDRLRNGDRRLKQISDITRCRDDQIVGLTVIGKLPALTRLNHQLQLCFADRLVRHLQENFYSPGWFWLTIQDCKATKDQAIATLIETLGYQDRQLVVFGDHSNDIKMFQIAHRRIAVANAIAEVKDLATEIIASNENDGVMLFIENEWLCS